MPTLDRRIAIALGSPTLQVCQISIQNFTGDTVSVRYESLSSNQPHSYDNFVAIWEATSIPWSALPLKQMPIPQDAQSGTVVIDGLTITASRYIVGYGVGTPISTICTSALLSAGGLMAPPTSVHIGINYAGTNSVSVSYQTLAGYRPSTYGNWIGLWKGYASPYSAPDPVGKVSIPTDSSEGSVGINDVAIAIKTTYTLIYFVGPELTEAAAILTFDTGTELS